MSTSYTYSDTTSFTLTHAKYLASKVRTDLMRIHNLYDGVPTIRSIDRYEEELTAFLKAAYLSRVTYGFKRDGEFISPSLKYEASDLIGGGVDHRPGQVPRNQDVSYASFSSFLVYSSKWYALSQPERDSFKSVLPFSRTAADEPTISGYLSEDKTYSAGGQSLNRAVVRSY